MLKLWKTRALLVAAGVVLTASVGCSSAEAPPAFSTDGPGIDEDSLTDDELGDLLMREDDRALELDEGLDVGTEPADEGPGDVDEADDTWQPETDTDEAWEEESPSTLGVRSLSPLGAGGTAAKAKKRPVKMFGLGVDAPIATASPLYPQLKDKWKSGAFTLGTARRVFYVEADPAKEEGVTDTWLAGLAGLEPMLGLSIHAFPWLGTAHPGRLTSHRAFRARFWRLLRKYPQVKVWGVTNEPDLELDRGKSWAKESVSYFVDGAQVLRRCLREKKCSRNVRLAAGEFSYQGDVKSEPLWKAYGDEMISRVKTKENRRGTLFALPKTWSFHPYRDTTYGNTIGTRAFSAFTRRLERATGTEAGMLRVWLTEAGTLLALGKAEKPRCLDVVGSYDKQKKGAEAVASLTKLGRVDRIYWWQFQQVPEYSGGIWDSALLDNLGRPRAAFCVLAGADRSMCTGDVYSKACPPGSTSTRGSVCDGKPDGVQCSPLSSLYGMECKGGALVREMKCPPPGTVCKGPSADGTTIACE